MFELIAKSILLFLLIVKLKTNFFFRNVFIRFQTRYNAQQDNYIFDLVFIYIIRLKTYFIVSISISSILINITLILKINYTNIKLK